MSGPVSQEDGTLVVRVTMNPKLRRVAFAGTLLHLLWCAALIVFAFMLVGSGSGELALFAIAAILVALSCWNLWRTIPVIRRKYRSLSMGMVTLRLDDLGVQVRDVPMQVDPAGLTWTDCAAVVVSRAPKGPEWPVQPDRYVQFVPVSEDRVELKGIRRNDVRTKLLGLSPTASSLTWLELPGSQPDADDVVAWITSRQPTKRVVGDGHSVTDE